MDAAMQGWRIRVRGLVQGVGFRPHVWRIARDEAIAGEVVNDGEGVAITAYGAAGNLERFIERLVAEAPPLSRIDAIERQAIAPPPVRPDGFGIGRSIPGKVATGVVPDAATCPACKADIDDPANRRFGYAFTNCTHCGPRLSIVRAIPYDRVNTSMQAFPMCHACEAEYGDPADRRFHAQPNACPRCGPRLWIEPVAAADGDDPVAGAAAMLRAGRIVSIKGIGGFHLACDAMNEEAVARLRRRKRRYAKPFAVMFRDVEGLRRHCRAGADEEAWLVSHAAPIVLVDGRGLAPSVAPGQDRIGAMLPYTPLHHLLLAACSGPLVMTSGNTSEEPQAIGNDEARQRLAGIADAWLMHDRDIVNRLDDSVVRIDAAGPQVIRRARGLAPEPRPTPAGFVSDAAVLAMGGELKAAFCLLGHGRMILSQHMGNLEEASTHADYRRNLDLYRAIFDFHPRRIAVDRHPAYLSTQWGRAFAESEGIPLVAVQHHHAHLAACLGEHGVPRHDDQALGIVLDGLGAGDDGTVWGGEFLAGGYAGFERAGHFRPVPLPGGAAAIREPWRNLAAHLHAVGAGDWQSRFARTRAAGAVAPHAVVIVGQMLQRGFNAPLSSSAGRLFDAAAAAIGIVPARQHHEGQAAMEMEALARPHAGRVGGYPVDVARDGPVPVLCFAPLWKALLDDLGRGTEPGVIAARFHDGLADGVAALAVAIASERGLGRVALSGGVMQNGLLLDRLVAALAATGIEVLTHRQVPANDGGLAFGQALVAATGVD